MYMALVSRPRMAPRARRRRAIFDERGGIGVGTKYFQVLVTGSLYKAMFFFLATQVIVRLGADWKAWLPR